MLGEASFERVMSRLSLLRYFFPANPSGSYSLALGLQVRPLHRLLHRLLHQLLALGLQVRPVHWLLHQLLALRL